MINAIYTAMFVVGASLLLGLVMFPAVLFEIAGKI